MDQAEKHQRPTARRQGQAGLPDPADGGRGHPVHCGQRKRTHHGRFQARRQISVLQRKVARNSRYVRTGAAYAAMPLSWSIFHPTLKIHHRSKLNSVQKFLRSNFQLFEGFFLLNWFLWCANRREVNFYCRFSEKSITGHKQV